MSEIGLTKARSIGPVADAVEHAGGSIANVFRRADLPLRLLDEPDRQIPLRDQLSSWNARPAKSATKPYRPAFHARPA